MRYTRSAGNASRPGRHGIAPPRPGVTSPLPPNPSQSTATPPVPPVKQPRRHRLIFGRIGRGQDFNYRRMEFSCLMVAEFACLLLALPVYLFFGRIGVWHIGPPPADSLSEGGWGLTLRFIALVCGALGMLFIPVLGKAARGRWLWIFAVAMFVLVLLMTGEWQGPLLAIVGYAAMAGFSLVTLDAVTAVRPAAEGAEKFIKLQLVAGGLVMVLWFMPMMLTNHSAVLHDWIGQNWHGWLYPAARIGPVAAELAGLAAVLGGLGTYRSLVNTTARLLATLGLACAMAVSLVILLRTANLPVGPANWDGLEFLWVFLLLTGCMLLYWAGVTQRLLSSAQEMQEITPASPT